MAQYPIPQFIEAEGKIISFLTFRQFFILVGGGACVLAFYYILPFTLFVIGSIFVGIIVAMVAFFKIDNTPVINILLNSVLFVTQSKNYVWKKKEQPYPFKTSLRQESIGPEPEKSKLHSTKEMVEYRKK